MADSAGVVELAYTLALEAGALAGDCGFKSHRRQNCQIPSRLIFKIIENTENSKKKELRLLYMREGEFSKDANRDFADRVRCHRTRPLPFFSALYVFPFLSLHNSLNCTVGYFEFIP